MQRTEAASILTHLSLMSYMWNISKQYKPRCDAAEHGIKSGAILFASRNFIKQHGMKK